MTKWEHINNKSSHSHLSYSHSRPIPSSLSNLVSIPMGIPQEGWEFRISHSHAHLYFLWVIRNMTVTNVKVRLTSVLYSDIIKDMLISCKNLYSYYHQFINSLFCSLTCLAIFTYRLLVDEQ